MVLGCTRMDERHTSVNLGHWVVVRLWSYEIPMFNLSC
jgi:hypothetical protein